MARLIFLLLFSLFLFAEEYDPWFIISAENEPSLLVENKVSAITGKLCAEEKDLVIQGVEPIVIRRVFVDGEWSTFPHFMITQVTDHRDGHTYLISENSGAQVRYQFTNQRVQIHNETYRKYVPTDLKNGYANTSKGIISSRTNLQNNVLFVGPKEKHLILQIADGTIKEYQRKHHFYRLVSEHLPNGNWVLYDYEDVKRKDETLSNLISIRTTNPSQTCIYARADFIYEDKKGKNYDFKIIGSDGQTAQYCHKKDQPKHDKNTLVTVTSSGHPDQSYQYFDFGYPLLHLRRAVSLISLPLNRALQMSYYTDQTRIVMGQAVTMHNQTYETQFNGQVEEKILPDPRCGRIKTLEAPVGSDTTFHITHGFFYDLPNRKTSVVEMDHQRTDYHWDDHFRVKEIARYDAHGTFQKSECFSWSESGHLLCKWLLDANRQPFSARTYTYNSRGDVTEEKFYGNLSGGGSSLVINGSGLPVENGVESYSRRFTYILGEISLLQAVEEDNGKRIEYSYLPHTDLPLSRCIYDHGHLKERKFWEYDSNHLLLRERSETQTTCLIQQITPKPEAPYFGMPWIIEEKYEKEGREHLIRKTVLHYTQGGLIGQKDIYDSAGQFCYSLKYKYDEKGRLIEQTDEEGWVEVFSYDSCGNRIYHKHPAGRKTATFSYDFSNHLVASQQTGDDGILLTEQYAYDNKHHLIREEKPLGFSAKYSYDSFGALSQKELSYLKTPYHYTHDSFGRLTSETDPDGFTTQTLYNVYDQPIRIEHPDGSIEKRIYYLNGCLKAEIDPEGVETSYTYDSLDNQTSKSVSFQGQILSKESFEYDGSLLIAKTDAEGHRTTYSYDRSGKLVSSQLENETTEFSYDHLNRLHLEKKANLCTVKEYDLLDRVIEERKEDLQGKVFFRIRYGYDRAGNQTSITRFIEGKEATDSFVYDSLARLTQTTDAMGSIANTTYEHTPFLKETFIDPLGLKTVKIHNAQGKVTHLETMDKQGKILRSEEYDYDFRGNPLRTISQIFTPSRKVMTLWAYDRMGRLAQLTEAADSAEERKTSYVYDKMGRLGKVTKPDNTILTYSYSPLGFLESLISSEGSVHYIYVHDRLGRLLSSTDMRTGQITKKQYDAHGHVLQEILETGYTFCNSYDPSGRRNVLTLPDGSRVHYEYDAWYLGSVTRYDPANQPLYTHLFRSYDQNESVLEEELIGNLGSVTHRYNLRGQQEELSSSYAFHRVLERDAAGNIVRAELDNVSHTFGYDDLCQLRSETGFFSHTYDHDAHQCRQRKDADTYDINHLLQITSHLKYDANGNPTQQGDFRYNYDALDRLIQIQSGSTFATYTYDSENRRLSKTLFTLEKDHWNKIQEQYFLYDGQNEIGSIDGSGKITELRILGLTPQAERGAAIAIELQGEIYAPIHDLMGNVLMLISLASQKPEISYHYNAFGEEPSNSPSPNPWRFSSKRIDEETGLVYYGRRYYSPSFGRWLTPDPVGFTNGLNLYAFVKNNPLIHTDLYGLYYDDLASSVHFYEACLSGTCLDSRKMDPLGDSDQGTAHYGCGINNSRKDMLEAREILYNTLDQSFAIQPHWLHNNCLFQGLMMVGLEKLCGERSLLSSLNFFLTPGLFAAESLVLNSCGIKCAIDSMVQTLSTTAQKILAEDNDRLKQVHIAFSNAGYVYKEALSKITDTYRDTVILITAGSTAIVDRSAAHKVYNIIGDKDWPSQICNGGRKAVRMAEKKGDAILIEQHETKSIIGGHYFTQPDYQEQISVIIDKEIKRNYEIY